MAEIQTLQDLYRKEGLKFMQELFNSYVIISEKINATRFCFCKEDSGNFTFYKKDGKITQIERTLNKLFEEPINYIESLPKSVKDKLLVGYVYGFRYFHNNAPIFVNYDKIPLNGLILTDIKNKQGKIIDDLHVLNMVSDLLVVEKPPIIWSGKLNDSQKTRILDYVKTTEADTKIKYNSTSFTHFIISVLNPSKKSTTLNLDINKPIDSIIFKFINDETKSIIHAKLVDPIMLDIKNSYEGDKEIKDMFGIILSDIVEFININGIDKYSISKLLNEDRYLELVFKIYNDYIRRNGYKFEGINLETPGFSNLPQFDLNLDLITNDKTRENIAKSDINKKIFKIIVSTFVKNRYKATGTITPSLIENIKEIKSKIENRIRSIDSIKNEGVFILTFEEYLNS
jgi:hypothetical protein